MQETFIRQIDKSINYKRNITMLKYIFCIITIILFTTNTFALEKTQDRPLIYSTIPIEQKEPTIAKHQPLVNYLQQTLEAPIELKYYETHKALLKAIINGKIDIAVLGPLPYLLLSNSYNNIEPIAIINEIDGKSHYNCTIFAVFDGPDNLTDIKTPIALTQLESTCGYLSINYLLHNKGINLEKIGYSFLGSHDDVVDAVLLDKFKTGCVKTSVFHKYKSLPIKAIATTDELPGFIMIANKKTMSQEQIQQLKDATQNIPKDIQTTFSYAKNGMSPISKDNMTIISKMLSLSSKKIKLEL